MILAAVREVLLKDCFPENDVEKTTLPVLRTVFEGKPCADFGKNIRCSEISMDLHGVV